MRGTAAASWAAAAAVIGLAAAPAAAEGGRWIEICTANGSAWKKLPPTGTPGDRDTRREQAGCAHALCPRGQEPARKRTGTGG